MSKFTFTFPRKGYKPMECTPLHEPVWGLGLDTQSLHFLLFEYFSMFVISRVWRSSFLERGLLNLNCSFS